MPPVLRAVRSARAFPALAALVCACGGRSSLDVTAFVDGGPGAETHDAMAERDTSAPDAGARDGCTVTSCPAMWSWDAVTCECVSRCPGDAGGQVTIASLDTTTTPAILNTAIAVRAGYVYWTADGDSTGSTEGAVFRTPRCGGTVTTIASGQTGPSSIAVDDGHVYWGTNGDANTGTSIGALQRASLTGGPATTLATGVAELSVQLTLDTQYVYSTGFQSSMGFPSNTDTWRAPLTGGPEMPLAENGNFKDIAVDAEHVFLSEQTNTFLSMIVSVPVAGGATTVLVPSGVDVSDLMVIDTGHIYYQADPPALMRVDKDGSGALMLATASMNALATDGQNVYWLEGDATTGAPNALKRVSVSGGATTVLSSSGGVAIALDETYVYWASAESDIYRLEK